VNVLGVVLFGVWLPSWGHGTRPGGCGTNLPAAYVQAEHVDSMQCCTPRRHVKADESGRAGPGTAVLSGSVHLIASREWLYRIRGTRAEASVGPFHE